MKATVRIEENHFTIELRPENEFEKTLIEDTEKECKNSNLRTTFSTNQFQTNHRITIEPLIEALSEKE